MTPATAVEGARLGTALLQTADIEEAHTLADHATRDELRVTAVMLTRLCQTIGHIYGFSIADVATIAARRDKGER